MILSCSWIYDIGVSTTRAKPDCGALSASRTDSRGRTLSLVAKLPVTWHDLIRTINITGEFDASDSAKPSATALVIDVRLGRGSSSQNCDFIAKAWLRSCMIEDPSP